MQSVVIFMRQQDQMKRGKINPLILVLTVIFMLFSAGLCRGAVSAVSNDNPTHQIEHAIAPPPGQTEDTGGEILVLTRRLKEEEFKEQNLVEKERRKKIELIGVNAEKKAVKGKIADISGQLENKKLQEQDILKKIDAEKIELLRAEAEKEDAQKRILETMDTLEKKRIEEQQSIKEEQDKRIALHGIDADIGTLQERFVDINKSIKAVEKKIFDKQQQIVEMEESKRMCLLQISAEEKAVQENIIQMKEKLKDAELKKINILKENEDCHDRISGLLAKKEGIQENILNIRNLLKEENIKKQNLLRNRESVQKDLKSIEAETKRIEKRISGFSKGMKRLESERRMRRKDILDKRGSVQLGLAGNISEKDNVRREKAEIAGLLERNRRKKKALQLSIAALKKGNVQENRGGLAKTLEKGKLSRQKILSVRLASSMLEINSIEKEINKLSALLREKQAEEQRILKGEKAKRPQLLELGPQIDAVEKKSSELEDRLKKAKGKKRAILILEESDSKQAELSSINAQLKIVEEKTAKLTRLLDEAELAEQKVAEEEEACHAKLSSVVKEKVSIQREIGSISDMLKQAALKQREFQDKKATQDEGLVKITKEKEILEEKMAGLKGLLKEQELRRQDILKKQDALRLQLSNAVLEKENIQKEIIKIPKVLEKEKLRKQKALMKKTSFQKRIDSLVIEKDDIQEEISGLKERLGQEKQNEQGIIEREKVIKAELQAIQDHLDIVRRNKLDLEEKKWKIEMMMTERKREENFKKLKEAEMAITEINQGIEALLEKKKKREEEFSRQLGKKTEKVINKGRPKGKVKQGKQKELEAKTKLDEEMLKFHYNLALSYDRSGKYKEAADEYEKALKIAPDDADTHYNLAIIYDDYLEDKEKAIEHYQRYLQLCPFAKDAGKVAGWIRKDRKDIIWGE